MDTHDKRCSERSNLFADRTRDGSRLIFDDHDLFDMRHVAMALTYFNFKVLEEGKHKIALLEMIISLETLSLVQRTISKRLERYKEAAIYSVDTIDQLQYVRGQIKSLEDLQQEIKDLLNKQEIEDENVHGDTETD